MLKFLNIFIILLLCGCNSTAFFSSHTNQVSEMKTAGDKHLADQSTYTSLSQEQQALLDFCPMAFDPVELEAFDNLWDRVTHQFSFEIPDNKRVAAQKKWYLKHPDYLRRVSNRAMPYLYYIVETLEANQLPLELALLPIVESAFDPFAYSHGRASGMWQFIPATAKNFGLKQNWWFDGRRDVYLSTQSAVKFLSYLQRRFDGNWLHALAAYNSGEGNVRKAIRKNKQKGLGTDFWSLDLPRETEDYVPKLLALADLLIQPPKQGHHWTPIANMPVFERVNAQQQIDLSLAASLADISMSDFYQLNPGFNQWATAPNGPHHILLPLDKVEIFNQNLSKIPAGERISYKRYTIKPGDSLSVIAKRFSTTTKLLTQHNELNGNAIITGKSLLIPVASEARSQYHKSSQQRLLASQNTHREGQKQVIEVSRGDSMWDLSREYKVNIRSLAKWNNMAPTDPIRVGQKLVVWTSQPAKIETLADAKSNTKKIYYTVRKGDSFARIANKFNLSSNHVKNWNKQSSRKKYLQPGEQLTLFVDITRQY